MYSLRHVADGGATGANVPALRKSCPFYLRPPKKKAWKKNKVCLNVMNIFSWERFSVWQRGALTYYLLLLYYVANIRMHNTHSFDSLNFVSPRWLFEFNFFFLSFFCVDKEAVFTSKSCVSLKIDAAHE